MNGFTVIDHRRKYVLNEGFFDNIDSEEKAYWLGFLLADGHVSDRGYVALALAAVDIEHIEKFKKSISATNPIKTLIIKGGWNEKKSKISRIICYSRQLTSSLREKGFTSQKTKSCRPPIVPKSLQRHFWRGVVDGDGYISVDNRGDWSISVCGTVEVVNGFVEFIYQNLAKTVSVYRTTTNYIFRAVCSGSAKPQSIIRLLYADSTIYLDRKKKLADKCLAISFPGSGARNRVWTDEQLLKIRLKNMETKRKISPEQEVEMCQLRSVHGWSFTQLSKRYNIGRETVKRWLVKNGF